MLHVVDGSCRSPQHTLHDALGEVSCLRFEWRSRAADLRFGSRSLALEEGSGFPTLASEDHLLFGLGAVANLLRTLRAIPFCVGQPSIDGGDQLRRLGDQRFRTGPSSTGPGGACLEGALHRDENDRAHELPKNDEAHELDNERYVGWKLDHWFTAGFEVWAETWAAQSFEWKTRKKSA